MNIISTQNYVAGIFEKLEDAIEYIEMRPDWVAGFLHLNRALEYPFYIAQLDDDVFLPFQQEGDAMRVSKAAIVFAIYEDYRPDPQWTDQMGWLEHTHFDDDDETSLE